MTIKIVFMGTPNIAVSMLKQILKDGYEVCGVVTQPDKKVGRKQVIQMPPVKEVALEQGIPVLQPIKIAQDYEDILALHPDLIVTCAYGQFIPQKVLEAPTYGSINVHASLLPKLRGGAPIHKAIINGDTETGISIMRMVKKMDAGAVMAQCVVPISEDETNGTLYDKLAIAGAQLLSQSIPKLIDGTARFVEQDESLATFAYTITKEEEHVDFQKPLAEVYNHIRGLIPSPAGYAVVNGKKMKFHRARKLSKKHNREAGEIIGMMDQGLAVAVDGGYILLDELQMEGKARVEAKAFYNGAGKNLVGQKLQ